MNGFLLNKGEFLFRKKREKRMEENQVENEIFLMLFDADENERKER